MTPQEEARVKLCGILKEIGATLDSFHTSSNDQKEERLKRVQQLTFEMDNVVDYLEIFDPDFELRAFIQEHNPWNKWTRIE